MQQLELSTPRRKLIGKLGIILILAVILLTFLSKTINNSLMPKVTTVQFAKGSLQEKFETDGTGEFSGKHKIFAGDSWRVEEVDVKVSHQVKKGDLLAVINKRDIQIEIKAEELELMKLENDIQSYKDSFEPIRLSDYERELQLAQRDMEEAKSDFDMSKELFEAGIDTKKNLENAENNYKDKLYLCQTKKEVLEEKKKKSTYQQDEFNRTVNEKTAELELKKLKFEKESNNLTKDGKILSDMDGLITAVNIEPGMNTLSDQVMFEIVDISCPLKVTWYMNLEKASSYAVGSEVNIEITGEVIEDEKKVIKSEVVKTQIAGKEFVADSDRCKYWADIDRNNNIKISVGEGQKARVWALLNSPIYDYLLPKNAVTQIQSKFCVFEVKKRQGAMGMEYYVEENEVEILKEDNFYCAVNGFFSSNELVVVNTTKPLTDGMQVRVR